MVSFPNGMLEPGGPEASSKSYLRHKLRVPCNTTTITNFICHK